MRLIRIAAFVVVCAYSLLMFVRSVNLQRRLDRVEKIATAAASVATDTRHDCLKLKTTPPLPKRKP